MEVFFSSSSLSPSNVIQQSFWKDETLDLFWKLQRSDATLNNTLSIEYLKSPFAWFFIVPIYFFDKFIATRKLIIQSLYTVLPIENQVYMTIL